MKVSLRYILIGWLFICSHSYLSGQATVLGTQTVNGAYSTYNLTDLGIFRQVRLQATTSGASGIRNWLFAGGTAPAAVDYTIKWCPYTAGLTLAGYDQTIKPLAGTASALFNYSPGGADGLMPAVTSGNYYTFNITEYSVAGTPADEYMGVMQTTYNPVTITSVTQSPIAASVYSDNSVLVTVNTSAVPSAGEYIYLRYSTTLNFVTSTLVQVNMSGTTGTVFIPCQGAGTTIYYYIYSSNKSSAAILADVGTFGQVAHDMSTLNINNNGGPNYQYTVLASAGNFCGAYYIPSSCYPTIASFVSALNSGTVTCSVTAYIAAGYTETAPAGGINLTQTGTAANTITFIKYGAGANPLITAQTGTVSMITTSPTVDGIFSLNGSDYITIDGIDLKDNNLTAPATMEYGYGLFKSNAADGSQYNTIKNCSITLNASNSSTGPTEFKIGSHGVILTNATRTAINLTLTINTASGRNDYNEISGNTITNTFMPIVVRGYDDNVGTNTYYDQGNIIGNSGYGNIIQNYGGAAAATYGIYLIYQNNSTISYNTINNITPHLSTLYGIFHSSAAGSSNVNTSITNNTISLIQGSNSMVEGIRTGNGGQAAQNIIIDYNTIQNCSYTVTSTANFLGIDQLFNAAFDDISYNTITNNTLNISSGTSYMIFDNNNSTAYTINNNTITNNIKSVSGAGSIYGYYNQQGATTGNATISYNTITDLITSGGTCSAVGIKLATSSAQTKTVSNNTISNITGGSGASIITTGILVNGMPSGSVVNDNTVSNISSTGNVVGINCASDNSTATSSNIAFTCSGNTVTNISTSGTLGAYGIAAYTTSSSGNVLIDNNIIDNVSLSGTGVPGIYGINTGGGAAAANYTISNNTISNIQHTALSGSATIGGIRTFTQNAPATISKNTMFSISGNSAGDQVMGILLTSSGITYNINNNFIQKLTLPNSSGSTGIYGISCYITSGTFNIYYNTIALGQDAVISGPGVAGVYYQTSGTLNLKNNIIYVNATPSGTGVASCIRRAYNFGSAGFTPPNFSTTSNNNYYWINTGANNYIYVEGISAGASLINGWAWSGATTSVPQNLNNDPCFNVAGAAPSSYKTFMSPRESGSYYDAIPFAGGALLPQNLKLTAGSTNYAESNASVIAGITTDWEGDARSGTTPDIGADEGAFVAEAASCYLLPLQLISFTGFYNGTSNELQWKTASEYNSDYFEIEKSGEGENFYTIGNVDAQGNSTVMHDYLFYDDNPLAGLNYYRLKMFDFDGSYTFSNIIVIELNGNGISNFVMYPNPVSENLFIALASSASKNVLIQIADMLGNKVITKTIELQEGDNTFEINTSTLPTGAYMLMVKDESTGEFNTAKFIKSKN